MSECDLELCKLMISHGADVNSVDEMKATVLHHCCYYEDQKLEKVEYFISLGASPKVLDSEEKSPLFFEVGKRNPSFEICKLFLDKGTDPNHKSVPYGENCGHPLCWRTANPQIFKLLLIFGLDVNQAGEVRIKN